MKKFYVENSARFLPFFLFPRRPGPVDVGHHPLAFKPEYFETAQLFKLLVIFLNFNSFF